MSQRNVYLQMMSLADARALDALGRLYDAGVPVADWRPAHDLEALTAAVAELGFLGFNVPLDYGGTEAGPVALNLALYEIARHCPQARLVLVGKGSLEGEIRMRTQRLGIEDRVVFLGWRSDIEQILPGFDLFVLPSLNEGMGRVLVDEDILGRAVQALEEKFGDQPLIDARLRGTIGVTYERLGRYERAEPQLDRALEIRKRVLGGDHGQSVGLAPHGWPDGVRVAEGQQGLLAV